MHDNETPGCHMLGEFVDDASQGRGESRRPKGPDRAECLKELVRQIASEMAVPQFHLGEVVERVLAVIGPQIEERVRKELQQLNDARTGTP